KDILHKVKKGNFPSKDDLELKDKNAIEELQGKLKTQNEDEKLLHSVLENDTDTIDDGKLINEAVNQGISAFTPDLMFENLTQNYVNAERLYGKKLIQLLTGYNPGYVKKNVRIPEFCRELKLALESNLKDLKKQQLLDSDGTITSRGVYLASLILYTEELDNLVAKGLVGKKEHKKKMHYGDKDDIRPYRSHDRYKDIDLKKSIKNSIRRKHSSITSDDLIVSERKAKGNIQIIYGLDASGSMKGKKIETAKKAGIALAFKAIEKKDKVGIIVFGSDIKEEIAPTLDFAHILSSIAEIKASQETNMTATIEKAIQLFPDYNCTKHLILLTDAMPTVGSEPEREVLKMISQAMCLGITISLIGIGLDAEGEKFAKKIISISNGRLYIINKLDDVDKVILQDYYETKAHSK
ncbi:MAG: vWA domain-containing protein, partial [Candidatus Woesearchaeota archaeon]